MTRPTSTVAWPRRATQVAALAAILVVVGAVAAALAFMTATGSGTTSASVGAINPPSDVAAQQAGADVSISWSAAMLSSGAAVQGYTVARSGGPTVCGVPTLVVGLSCTDTSAPAGTQTYAVTAVYNTFTAAASSASIAVLGAPTMSASPSNPSANSTPSFAFAGDGSGFQCQLDSGPVATCLSPKSYPGVADGSHTVRVRATRGAVAGPFASHTWTLDTSAPSITAKPSNPSATDSPAFSFSHGQAAYGFTCRLDAADFSACTSSNAHTGVSDGSHTFQVRALDADGAATVVASYTWLLDTTAPTSAWAPAGGVIWDNSLPNSIGRGNLDGTGVNQNLITGAGAAKGVAANSSHLYWSNETDKKIGRSDVDGSSPDRNFISGPFSPYGVAVDASYVYWSDIGFNAIGRANLDGSDVRTSFVPGANGPLGIAVDGSHIYWANINASTIGRANLDGSSANQSFITGANYPSGVAVSGSHVYWANLGGSSIGRANLDGSSPDQSFMTGIFGSFGVAVDGARLYFTTWGGIGRANLDGSGANQGFISGGSSPHAVAVVPEPANSFLSATRLYYNGNAAGSLRLTAAVADAGSGPAAATFPDISTGGWTHAAETVTTGGGSYTSSAFSWTAIPGNPTGYGVSSTDAAGNTSSPSPLEFVSDTNAPTGGALSVNGTAATSGGSTSAGAPASFTIDSRTDAGEAQSASDSGLKASTLTVQSASLTAGACGVPGSAGPFASPVTVTGTTQPSGIVSGFCYVYTLTGGDKVGNVATIDTTVQAP